MGKIQGLFKDLSRFFNFQGLFKGLMLFQGLFKARANHVEPFLTNSAAVELFSELKCSMGFSSIEFDSRNEVILCGSFHAERQKRKKSSTEASLARFQLRNGKSALEWSPITR